MTSGPVNLELEALEILRRTDPLSPSRALVGKPETKMPLIGEAGSWAGVGVLLPELPFPLLLPDEPLPPLEPEEDEPVKRSTIEAALGVPSPVAVSYPAVD